MAYYRNDKILKKFGLRLREIRKLKNITQEQLAEKSGFILSQIGRIERGEINTSLSHLCKLSEALDISLKELVDF